MTLTAKRIQRLRTQGVPGRHLDAGRDGVRGLYLEVSGPRAASWILRYERAGKTSWMGLGSVSIFGLAEARERAKAQRRLLADKVDPLAARRAERAAQAAAEVRQLTFKQCTEQYLIANRGQWKSVKHSREWEATVRTYAWPIVGQLPVAAIDTGLVLKILEQPVAGEQGDTGPLWGVRRVTAARLRGRIESILAWATVRGLRSGDNPAKWQNHLEEALPKATIKVAHLAALPWQQLPEFMAKLRRSEGSAARALEFAILTAARSGEVLGARWAEIDFEGKTWTVPAERMKRGNEHVVPLSDAALALLRDLPREDGPFLFIGAAAGGKLGETVMFRQLRRMGHDDMTVHGFRATFRAWCAEQTSTEHIVAELSLGHTQKDELLKAYQRGALLEKRRQLMAVWANYIAGSGGDNVIPLPVAR
jgi:integrase